MESQRTEDNNNHQYPEMEKQSSSKQGHTKSKGMILTRTPQYAGGQRVGLAALDDNSIRVGTRIVHKSQEEFHGEPIRTIFLRINIVGEDQDTMLEVSVERAEQFTLHDAVGSNTLWRKTLTFADS